jgi:hypothetical protein
VGGNMLDANQYYAIKLVRKEKFYAGYEYRGNKRLIRASDNLREVRLYKHFVGSKISDAMQMLLV